MFGMKKRRRARLREKPFPDTWLAMIKRNVPYYNRLPEEDQEELRGHVAVFLDEKVFEGCGGLGITDEIRVTVAAHACVLLLHRETDYYPRLVTVLVYPHSFVVPSSERGDDEVVSQDDRVLDGEAWGRGVVVLAWDSVKQGFWDEHDGDNVVFHEFAHQLDMENGEPNGFPRIADPRLTGDWSRVFSAEYRLLQDDLDMHRPTVIGEYGATDPAEFFAVVTECFFERPHDLSRHHPALYGVLKRYYQQDPLALL